MTRIRFVGDLPVFWGALIALLAVVLSWRYYRRESFDLPGRLKWLLPGLRSMAFVLGILILTGPVLHHRRTIGELGHIKVFFDGSQSMTMRDRQMSLGRKLLIAEQLGWIETGKLETAAWQAAEQLRTLRQHFLAQQPDDLNEVAVEDPQALAKQLEVLTEQLKDVAAQLESEPATLLQEDVIDPLELLATTAGEENTASTVTQVAEHLARCADVEQQLGAAFERAAQETVATGDDAILGALALFDETPRWRRAELGLLETTGILEELQTRHQVDVFRLQGEEAVPVEVQRDDETGRSVVYDVDRFSLTTDLVTGLSDSVQRRLAENDDSERVEESPANTAIVLLSDGQHHAGTSPVQVARLLGAQGIPIDVVSIGADVHAVDAAVLSLEHPDAVFRNDRVRGTLIIRDRVPAGTPLMAQIRHQEHVLWQAQLTSENSDERRIPFEFGLAELTEDLDESTTGAVTHHALPLHLEASLNPLADETELSNNRREMRIAAIMNKHKVLLLDGRSRWETRYLRNLFDRDDQWELNSVLAGPATDAAELPRGEFAGQFPNSREALFEYELLILGELPANQLAPAELNWIRDFVEVRGGGLILVDGQRGELSRLAAGSLAPLFPVEWLEEPAVSGPLSLSLTAVGNGQAAFSLHPETSRNPQFWQQLPPPQAVVPVQALPGSEVHVTVESTGRTFPAIVSRRVGAGQVVYFAFDETWRWRYKSADRWHQRFWNQIALFVMPRSFSVSDQFVSIDSGPISYGVGERASIRVKLLGLDERPATSVTAEALLWKDGRIAATIDLTEDADVPGLYRGQTAQLSAGEYEVSVRASGFSQSALQARSEFAVFSEETAEMKQTAANEQLLRQMAAESQGHFLREEDLGRLTELLNPLSSGRVVESETLLWQSYWWFAAILLLLTIEWILRKRAGLL